VDQNWTNWTESQKIQASGKCRKKAGQAIWSGFPERAYFLTVHWFSNQQANITLSTTEAEYVAMTVGGRDILWLRQLLVDLGDPPTGPTPLFVDNLGAVHLSKDPIVSNRSRHVGVGMHFIRHEQLAYRTLFVIHQPAKAQVADYLTKPLGGPPFRHCISLAGQINRPLSADKGECQVQGLSSDCQPPVVTAAGRTPQKAGEEEAGPAADRHSPQMAGGEVGRPAAERRSPHVAGGELVQKGLQNSGVPRPKT
jgi:hypothetical protein